MKIICIPITYLNSHRKTHGDQRARKTCGDQIARKTKLLVMVPINREGDI